MRFGTLNVRSFYNEPKIAAKELDLVPVQEVRYQSDHVLMEKRRHSNIVYVPIF